MTNHDKITRPLRFAGLLALAHVAASPLRVAAQDAPGINRKSLNAQLIEFAKKGDDARAMKVLDQGADPNTRNRSGQTALYLFAQKGKTEAVAKLIQKGADVNLETLDKTTPLMVAAHGGYLAVAKLLVENGADIQRRDQIELDAVMYAAGRGHVEVMNYLIEQGKFHIRKIAYFRFSSNFRSSFTPKLQTALNLRPDRRPQIVSFARTLLLDRSGLDMG